jgi:hypothetical protein
MKRERELKKMDKCSSYLKQWVLRYLPEKKREKEKKDE